MFGAGEIVLIVILAVVLLGPDKLPEFARSLGKIYAEYQKARREIELELFRIEESKVNTSIENDIKKIISDDVGESNQVIEKDQKDEKV